MKEDTKTRLEKENTENPDFKKNALRILRENAHLIIFTRYSANKQFYHIKSEKEFDEFLKTRLNKESLTLFKNKFTIINSGIVNQNFIQEVKAKINQEKEIDWVAIGKEKDNSQWSAFIANEEEFEEVIEDELDREIIIIEDQDWLNEDITIHAYVPDDDGVVRPGSY